MLHRTVAAGARQAASVATRRCSPMATPRIVASRRALATTMHRFDAKKPADASARKGETGSDEKPHVTLSEIRSAEDLLGPGARPGEVPTDLDQATGLERLELLGKMEGVDVFDMRPLESSRTGTMDDPIMVKSAGDEQYLGCTGCPADSHIVKWLTISRDRPIERCPECGSVYKMEYAGPQDDGHGHGHGHHDHHHEPDYPILEEPKTFAHFIKPEYRYR